VVEVERRIKVVAITEDDTTREKDLLFRDEIVGGRREREGLSDDTALGDGGKAKEASLEFDEEAPVVRAGAVVVHLGLATHLHEPFEARGPLPVVIVGQHLSA